MKRGIQSLPLIDTLSMYSYIGQCENVYTIYIYTIPTIHSTSMGYKVNIINDICHLENSLNICWLISAVFYTEQ